MAVPQQSGFLWGAGGQKLSAVDVARNRQVAEALARSGENPQTFWEGMQSLTGDVGSALLNHRADEAEKGGRQMVADALLKAQQGGDPNAFISVLGNEFASPAQSAVAQALLNRQFQMEDRDASWDRQDDMRAEDWERQDSMRDEDRSFEVEDRDLGWGRQDDLRSEVWTREDAQREQERQWAIEDANAAAAAKAAPAAAKEEVAQGRRETATATIVDAAATARDLAKNEGNLGISGKAWALKPDSEAAELRRQVHVLQSQASIENLTAMRQASPTGGALGSVSEKENAMLAAAAGAIDPDSGPADFARQLDNYERTLLRIVHGPVEGDRIYEATRVEANAEEVPIDDLVKKYLDGQP